MSCIIVTCSEFANLNHLAVYSVFTNAIDASFGITTLIMLGHLGKGHLAAGVIALAFYNVSWYFIEGLLTAQDSLVARSFALNDRESARYWSYISCGVAILLWIPGTVLFIMAAIIIQYAFLIRAHTAVKAAEFLILLIPGLWAHSLFRVAQKYLQCQQKMVVPIICGLIGISANLLGEWSCVEVVIYTIFALKLYYIPNMPCRKLLTFLCIRSGIFWVRNSYNCSKNRNVGVYFVLHL